EPPVKQVLQTRIRHLAPPIVASMIVGVNLSWFSNLSSMHALDGAANPGRVTHLMPYLKKLSGFCDSVHNILGILSREAKSLLSVHRPAAFHRGNCILRVEHWRRSDKDRIQVLARQKFLAIQVGRHFFTDQFIHVGKDRWIHVANSDNLYTRRTQQLPYQLLSAAAGADDSDVDAVVGGDGLRR